MFYFGMSVESEARRAARLAKQQGLHQAIIVTVRSSLSQRLQTAFEEEWSNENHGILREIEFSSDITPFADIGDTTDMMVFLAADAAKARLIRPYLPGKVPVYATSQIFSGNDQTLTNYDLNGIRFVDMPWLLQPEHPAVMVYARSIPPLPIDRERLYALGVDAFRLVNLMIAGHAERALPMDGVSGRIYLNGHIFQREAMPARFAEGQARVGDAPTSSGTQMFPGQEVAQP
jgi:outer membrane PBP1 activator LpoA protein